MGSFLAAETSFWRFSAQLAQIIKELIEAPTEIKVRVKDVIQPRKQDMQEVAGGAKKGGE